MRFDNCCHKRSLSSRRYCRTVLPFKPLSKESSEEYFEIGIADALISRLCNLKQLTVRPTSSVRRFGGVDQDRIAAGKELKVDAVVDGNRLEHQSDTNPYRIAEVYVELGKRDEGFQRLNRAEREHSLWVIWLKADPLFDSLHDDPRWPQLMHSLGLDKQN